MARSIWSGYISFGMVSIPVALYSATQEHEVRFNQFQRGTSDRIRYKRVNERTGREVDYDDIVKGHDLGGGEYVIVEPEELAEIAPGRSRALEISGFVDLDEIDPIHFQKSYFVGPSDQENTTAYALLRDALAETNRAAVSTFVMRSKEYLAAVRADGPVLVLETMFFADEIRDPKKELDELPPKASNRKQLSMAVDLIETMSGPWRPTDYKDTFTERVKDLIEAKRRGEEIVRESEPEATNVADLLTALQASVDAARSGGKGRKRRRAGKPTKAAGRPSPDDLRKASKAELTKLARDLDVPGRSKMSHEELADAVAKAQQSLAA